MYAVSIGSSTIVVGFVSSTRFCAITPLRANDTTADRRAARFERMSSFATSPGLYDCLSGHDREVAVVADAHHGMSNCAAFVRPRASAIARDRGVRRLVVLARERARHRRASRSSSLQLLRVDDLRVVAVRAPSRARLRSRPRSARPATALPSMSVTTSCERVVVSRASAGRRRSSVLGMDEDRARARADRLPIDVGDRRIDGEHARLAAPAARRCRT